MSKPENRAEVTRRAWEAWQKTGDFSNAMHYATTAVHTQSSLWGAFAAGFKAGRKHEEETD